MLHNLLERWRVRRAARQAAALDTLKARYHAFRILLENNGRALECLAGFDGTSGTARRELVEELVSLTGELVDGLDLLSDGAHPGLFGAYGRIAGRVEQLGADTDPTPERDILCLSLDGLPPEQAGLAGTKAATLARLRGYGLPVPPGFVVTATAVARLLAAPGLDAQLRRLLDVAEADPGSLAVTTARIREAILAAPMPAEVEHAVRRAWADLAAGLPPEHGPLLLAARSSGTAEDRAEHSFAGQYATVLGISTPQALLDALREVAASAFGQRALAYRRHMGLPRGEADMAVLCQAMVPARTAGVLFTRDPARAPGSYQADDERMLVVAVPGLGTLAVDGAAPADVYLPARDPAAVRAGDVETRIARKTLRETLAPDGTLVRLPVPAEDAETPALSPPELAALVRLARMVEGVEGGPQDIEWAVHEITGAVHLLQARPLRMAGARPPSVAHQDGMDGAPLLRGACASPGKAVGRVHLAHRPREFAPPNGNAAAGHEGIGGAGRDGDTGSDAAPYNDAPAVLVLPHSIPDAATHLDGYAAILVEAGNPADHLSCVARERSIPMLVGVAGAMNLPEGAGVLVDAGRGAVLEVPDALWDGVLAATRREAARRRTPQDRETPGERELRALIVPLNLTDAYGPTFNERECRSLHDIVRYVHEKAVLAMFRAGDEVMETAGTLLRRVELGVPFHVLAIDVGGGFRNGAANGGARRTTRGTALPTIPEDVASAPFAALCEGLTTPGLAWGPPDGGVPAGLLSRALLDGRGERPVGEFNYALVSRDYCNLNARVEYHFAMLDALCTDNPRENHIHFRFKGGGTGGARRARRIAFMREVLTGAGFFTAAVDDLLTATLAGEPAGVMRQRLVLLGRLLGYTRLLDAAMADDDAPALFARAFLSGRYDTKDARALRDGADRLTGNAAPAGPDKDMATAVRHAGGTAENKIG